MSRRALALLLVLAAIAVGLSLVVSVTVPPSWNDWLRFPRFGLTAPDRPSVASAATPLPTVSAGATPEAAGGRGQFPRTGGARAFLPFGAVFQSPTGIEGFGALLATLLLFLAVGVLVVYLIPQRVGCMALAMGSGPGGLLRLALTGLAGYVVVSVLGVLAIASVLGAFAWLVLLPVAYFATLISMIAASLPLGRFITRRIGLAEQPPLVDLLAGLLIVFIVGLIPFLGIFGLLALALVGLGAVIQTRAGSPRGWDFNLDELQY